MLDDDVLPSCGLLKSGRHVVLSERYMCQVASCMAVCGEQVLVPRNWKDVASVPLGNEASSGRKREASAR